MPRTYPACRLARVVDGDTVYMEIDHGFQSIRSTQDMRLFAVNTPERNMPDWDTATAFTQAWFDQRAPKGDKDWPFEVTTYKTEAHGRYVAVIVHTASGDNLNDALRQRWPADPRAVKVADVQ